MRSLALVSLIVTGWGFQWNTPARADPLGTWHAGDLASARIVCLRPEALRELAPLAQGRPGWAILTRAMQRRECLQIPPTTLELVRRESGPYREPGGSRWSVWEVRSGHAGPWYILLDADRGPHQAARPVSATQATAEVPT